MKYPRVAKVNKALSSLKRNLRSSGDLSIGHKILADILIQLQVLGREITEMWYFSLHMTASPLKTSMLISRVSFLDPLLVVSEKEAL